MGMTKRELVAAIGNTSLPTVQRAFDELRDRWGATLTNSAGRWRLKERMPLPLLAPEANDVLAVMVAAASIDPLLDDQLRARLVALIEQLDDRRREVNAGGRVPTRAIRASLTLGTRIGEDVMRVLLEAARRGVVRIRYHSPWSNAIVDHVVEPWELQIHDGTVYLRAWCRRSSGPRTFRLAQVREVERLAEEPEHEPPPSEHAWAAGNPAYGIDEDRPATAVVLVGGAVARWLFPVMWSPAQRDRWIEPDELLERVVPYRSCREMARRVLSILDAVISIEPPALREEVELAVAVWRKRAGRRRS